MWFDSLLINNRKVWKEPSYNSYIYQRPNITYLYLLGKEVKPATKSRTLPSRPMINTLPGPAAPLYQPYLIPPPSLVPDQLRLTRLITQY